jgi:hypothetical protein
MGDRMEYHETLGPVIDIGISAVQLRHRFSGPERHSEAVLGWPVDRPGGGSTTGPVESQPRANGRT